MAVFPEMGLPKYPRILFLCLFAGTLIAVAAKSYFFRAAPIYSDEVSYRMASVRYLLDGGERISFFAPCISSYAMPMPFMMRIAAYALTPLSLIHDFSLFRYIAMAVLLLGIGCLAMMGRRFELPPHRQGHAIVLLSLVAFVLSVETFSPASSALFMLRGEYFLSAGIPLLLFATGKKNKSARACGGWYVAALFLFCLAAYMHPKTLFFLPFFAAFVWFLFPQASAVQRGLLLVPFLVAAKQSADVITAQWMTCKEYPGIAAYNATFNIDILDLLKGKWSVISDILDNNSPDNLLKLLDSGSFLSYDDNMGYFQQMITDTDWAFNGYLLANIFIAWCLVLIAMGVVIVFRAAGWRTRNSPYASEQNVMKLACIGTIGVLAHLMLNRARHFYDFAAWSCWLTLFSAFGLFAFYSMRVKADTTAGMEPLPSLTFFMGLAAFLFLGNMMNAIVLEKTYYAPIVWGWHGDYTPILSKNIDDERQRVQKLLYACGVFNENARLIVDDMVYPYVENYPKPAAITGLWTVYERESLAEQDAKETDGAQSPQKQDDPERQREKEVNNWRQALDFMKTQKIAAMIGMCPSFKPGYPGNVSFKEPGRPWSDSFCCIPPQR